MGAEDAIVGWHISGQDHRPASHDDALSLKLSRPFGMLGAAAAAGLTFILSGCSPAEPLGRSARSSPDSPPSPRLVCDLSKHKVESAELHVVQVRHALFGWAEVRVEPGGVPLVVLLSSEQPVRWRLRPRAGAKIERVILVGDGSKVLGLTPATRLSRCGEPDGFVPFSPETVDRVADSRELSIGAHLRSRMAAFAGYDLRSRPYPNLDPGNPYDRCRIDLDWAGENITRRNITSAEDCRKFCDFHGLHASSQGRTVCVFEGARLKAYGAARSIVSRSCRFLTPSGRNIRSYPSKTEADCRETVCYSGSAYWRKEARDRRGSQCTFNGRVIESHGLRDRFQ